MTPEPSEFTRLLQQADRGDAQAANDLFVLVQDQLKKIASQRLQDLAQGVDLSTTALVDEAFCRLIGKEVTDWEHGSRRKFFAYITNRIHAVMIDAARAETAQKRGGDYRRVADADGQWQVPAPDQLEDVQLFLDLQESLERFAEFASDDALVFRLRYFLGCTFDEVADILSISATAAKRAYQRAQSWLRRELKEYHYDA